MKCEAVAGMLSPYVDGRLAGKALKDVRGHLEVCPNCAAAVRDLERVRRSVARAGQEPLPERFEDALRQRIEAAERRSRWGRAARSGGWLAALGSWSPGMRVAAGVAAAVLLVAVAGSLSRLTGVEEPNAPFLTDIRSLGAGPETELGFSEESRAVGDLKMAATKAAPAGASAGALDRKIITEASLSLEVQDFPKALERVLSICQAAGGYIADTTTSADSGREGRLTRGTVVARVPAQRFDSVMGELENLGKLRSKNITGTDVTEEYVDTSARLRNWREQEKQLLVILTRATRVGDVLAVQSELFRVREEIERLTGRINYLDHMTSMATIRVELAEPKKAAFLDFDLGFGRAIRRAIEAFAAGINAMVVFVGGAMPFAVVGVVAWLVVSRVRRGRGV